MKGEASTIDSLQENVKEKVEHITNLAQCFGRCVDVETHAEPRTFISEYNRILMLFI